MHLLPRGVPFDAPDLKTLIMKITKATGEWGQFPDFRPLLPQAANASDRRGARACVWIPLEKQRTTTDHKGLSIPRRPSLCLSVAVYLYLSISLHMCLYLYII